MDKYEKEIMDQLDMNITAMGEVLADAIDDLAKTTVFDDMYDAKQDRLDKMTQDYVRLLEHKRNYDIQLRKVELEKNDPRKRIPEKEKFFERDSVIRASGDIGKAVIIGTMSFLQVWMLWKLEKDGYLFSRNLNKVQLPRP